MEYRILGPLEVVDEGGPVVLGRLKERLVLAVLLLHANEFVSRERLIDELWGAAPPPTAKKAVNVYVSQLRKALARNGHDPIATADGGYRIGVDADQLDAARVRQLIASARKHGAAGELEAAAELLRETLALWRGPTLAGLLLESHGRDEVAQLDELRLTALMDRIDCDLALGRHEDVLGELHVLVGEHPLRERLRAQQMLALYRADRQAEALAVYQQARDVLVEELGIEPSEALQRLQQAILRHDSSLETPSGTAAVNGALPGTAAPRHPPTAEPEEASSRPRRRPRRWKPAFAVVRPVRLRRRWQLALVILLILVASGTAATILSTTSARATPHIVPNSLVRIDPRSGKIVSVVRVGREPGSIAITPSAIWTANSGDGTVSRYDLRTHSVQSRGAIGSYPYDIVADNAGNVWVSDRASSITRLVVGTGETSRGSTIHVLHSSTINPPASGAGSLALGGGCLWVIAGPLTLPEDNTVSVVNLATERPVRTLRLKGDTTAIAFANGAAWVSTNDGGNGLLYPIRAGAALPRPYRIELGDSTFGVAVGDGYLWILTWGTNGGVGAGSLQQVLEVDPHTGDVVRRMTFDGRDLWALAAAGGSVWVLADAAVIQLDPSSRRVIRTIPLPSHGHAATCGIAAANDAVWVTMSDGSECSTGAA
jgi:DNA-binding SARP family transcriptional activator/streptogramin lyase